MSGSCVHGRDPRESERLHDQAGTPADPLHDDTSHRAGSLVIRTGCGVGLRRHLRRTQPDLVDGVHRAVAAERPRRV